ncbi:RCC1L protein, partial [Polypterus senegalus]
MALARLSVLHRETFKAVVNQIRGKTTKQRYSQSRSELADPHIGEEPVYKYVGERVRKKQRIFVWGFSYTGALGIPSFVVPDSGRKKPRKYQLNPYRLEMDAKISSAACGYGFTLLSSKTQDLNKVWGMGLNKDSQLGFQSSQRDRSQSYEYVLEPSPVPLPLEKPQKSKVTQVACGRAHSLVLTDAEGVFSLGNNAYGQCGRKIVEDEVYSGSHVIHKVQGFDSRVVQVACGQDHSLFLTETGKVYSCGWGADGQTGLGHHNMTSQPQKLGGDLEGVQVKQVTTYGDCSLAISQEGELFGWGNSEYLQLSAITESTQVNIPRRLPFTEMGRVKQVACGGTQVAVLSEDGHVFVWGYGILGKGPNLSESRTPELIPQSLFGGSEHNQDVFVTQIRCGLHHFAAITGRGELFVWGKNLRGCLGVGRQDDQYFPWRLVAALIQLQKTFSKTVDFRFFCKNTTNVFVTLEINLTETSTFLYFQISCDGHR